MNGISRTAFRALCAALLVLPAVAAAVPPDPPAISGQIRFEPLNDHSSIAVWCPLPEGMALAGVTVSHAATEFAVAGVQVIPGTGGSPASLTTATSLPTLPAVPVAQAWRELAFEQPICSSLGGLFVVLRCDGSRAADTFGFDVLRDAGGASWVTADGEQWVKLTASLGFAVIPRFVPAEAWMDRLEGTAPEEAAEDRTVPADLATGLLRATPNPFNPVTEIRFTLARNQRVKLAVYDVKGRHLLDLATGDYAAGEHSVTWEGQDRNGRKMPSGVYFARLQAGAGSWTQRLMLVK